MRISNQDGEIFVGSRSYWKKESDSCPFWRAYRATPSLERFIKGNPHLCVFGENYGNNIDWREDAEVNQRKFRAFDLFDIRSNSWLNSADFYQICTDNDIPFCPIIYKGPFDIQKLLEIVEQDSPLRKGQAMEGGVVVPEVERWDKRIGRVKAKIVSFRYSSK